MSWSDHISVPGLFSIPTILNMAIPVMEFQVRGYKIRKIQHTQMKLLNFENWCSGKLSKIGHNFSNNMILKSCYQKMYS